MNSSNSIIATFSDKKKNHKNVMNSFVQVNLCNCIFSSLFTACVIFQQASVSDTGESVGHICSIIMPYFINQSVVQCSILLLLVKGARCGVWGICSALK